MKLLHLSDLHIGLKLMNYDLRQDQEYVLQEVVRIAGKEEPDAVLIAGDIYDKAIPSAEAVEVFDQFVTALSQAVPKAEIMMISGNHDSAMRVNAFRRLLNRQHIHMIGLPPMREGERIEKVTLRDEYGPVEFYLLPFVKPSMIKETVGTDENGNNLSYDESIRRLLQQNLQEPADRGVDKDLEKDLEKDPGNSKEAGTAGGQEAVRRILVSHQFYLPKDTNPEEIERSETEIRTVGNIDAVKSDVLAPFDYAALGHIHKPMKVGKEAYRYPGTPYATSVSEAGQTKGILKVELKEKGNLVITRMPIEPLHKVRILEGTLQEVLQEACEDYVTVILTDQADLDVMDMQDRLRSAFVHLLEIRRKTERSLLQHRLQENAQRKKSTYELCSEFLGELEEGEQALLQDVVNTVMEQEVQG